MRTDDRPRERCDRVVRPSAAEYLPHNRPWLPGRPPPRK
jgi:hypothetical protein